MLCVFSPLPAMSIGGLVLAPPPPADADPTKLFKEFGEWANLDAKISELLSEKLKFKSLEEFVNAVTWENADELCIKPSDLGDLAAVNLGRLRGAISSVSQAIVVRNKTKSQAALDDLD